MALFKARESTGEEVQWTTGRDGAGDPAGAGPVTDPAAAGAAVNSFAALSAVL